jgi:hypothetical protein
MEGGGSPDGIAAWLAAGARVPGVAGRWPLPPTSAKILEDWVYGDGGPLAPMSSGALALTNPEAT